MARNPLGDGHLRPSALSFVGGDHPDRHPPHSAPNDRRSPPRPPRDFSHGLPVSGSEEEPPPLGSWGSVYAAVLAHLAFWILLFYLFTVRFDPPS